MVKLRELTECGRVAVKYLRLLGLSFAEIGEEIGCSESTAFNVFKKFEMTGSTEKPKRNGRSKKGSKLQAAARQQESCDSVR